MTIMTNSSLGAETRTAFRGLKVVELATGMAGPLAGMIFADNGAEVVKIEPPTGDWARGLPGFQMWNRGKASVCADLHSASDVDSVRALIGTADVVIETLAPSVAHKLSIDDEGLVQEYRNLVVGRISGFVDERLQTTHSDYEGIVAAATGRMLGADEISGGAVPDAASRPVFISAPIGSYGAAMLAVQGIIAALLAVRRDGLGQVVETSLVDALTAATMRLRFERDGGKVTQRQEADNLVLEGIKLSFLTARCRDGRYIQMCARTDEHFRNWLHALDLDHLVESGRFPSSPLKFQSTDDIAALEQIIRTQMQERTQSEWMERFINGPEVGADPFLTPWEFLEHPQMIENERVVTIDDPILGSITQVGPLVLFSETPSLIARPAPALGAQQRVLVEAANAMKLHPSDEATDTEPLPCQTKARDKPLAGIVILELGTFIAAPLGATILAELGARVIKVEPPAGDQFRRVGLESLHTLKGKESLTLDLKSPESVWTMKELIRRADVLFHNMRPGVDARLGIDYESVRRINPSLVYLYASAYGSRGSQRNRAAFHSTPNALCGGGILQAGVGNPPVDDSYPDPCAGLAVGAAIAMGLFARASYGCGQRMETTMLASTGYVHSNSLVRYESAPLPTPVDGLQQGMCSIYRLYQCQKGWLFLAAVREQHWPVLARMLGGRWVGVDWHTRCDHEEELRKDLEQLFATDSAEEWVLRLSNAGVPACIADNTRFEEFLVENEYVLATEDPVYGPFWAMPPRMRFSRSPNEAATHAPAVGEQSEAILAEFFSSTEPADAEP